MVNSANLQIFTQTSFDSGSLGGLGAVVHRLDQSGEHRITVFQADKPIQTMPLRVVGTPQQTETNAPTAPRSSPLPPSVPTEVHVNLARALGQVAAPLPEDLVVIAQGYAVFHAPPGAAGFAVQLHSPGGEKQPPAFDSRQLHNGDIFTVTLLRPGRYSLTSTGVAAKGEIRVSYPVVGNTRYRPPDPLEVQVNKQGFQPHAIHLSPAQGLIFHVGDITARIQIDLVEPDDGPGSTGRAPGERRRPLFRWEKPEAPES